MVSCVFTLWFTLCHKSPNNEIKQSALRLCMNHVMFPLPESCLELLQISTRLREHPMPRDSHGLPRRVAKRRCRGKAPWGAPSFSQHLRDHPREVYPGTASIIYRTNYMDGLWRLYNSECTSYIFIYIDRLNIIIQYDSSWYTQTVFHIIHANVCYPAWRRPVSARMSTITKIPSA